MAIRAYLCGRQPSEALLFSAAWRGATKGSGLPGEARRPSCWTLPILLVALGGCGLAGGPARHAGTNGDPPTAAKGPLSPAAARFENQPFWWGVSVSAYQTEDPGPAGELDCRTDWDLFHERAGLRAARGKGTLSYTHFERDIRALKKLGVTHYRFGPEWARVEPKPGNYNEAAIEHYVKVARRLRLNGITPVVCLWHFTFPSWLADFDRHERHGWLHPDAPERWRAYVRLMVERFGDHVSIYAPMNEPNAYALAILIGVFPPGGGMYYSRYQQNIERSAEAFLAAAQIIRELRPEALIVSIQSIIHWERDAFDWFGFWYGKALEYNYEHLDRIAEAIDWVGFNYYFSEIATPLAQSLQALRSGDDVSDMGWLIDPDGLRAEIDILAERYGKPLVIMENGIAAREDKKRQQYLMRHLLAVKQSLRAGRDVRGYFHWSLIDNYEWHEGYKCKFGLFELSKDGKDLVAKDSAELYHYLIKNEFIGEDDRRR